MNYNPDPITYEEWRKKYKPLFNGEDYEQAFETYESDSYEWDWTALIAKATKYAKGDADKAFLHIWTEVDSDSGEEIILCNGIRRVNRIQYYVCEVPFADTVEEGLKYLLEVHND